jgi:hypothetical protein
MKNKTVDLRAFARTWDGGCLIRIPGVCKWAPCCLCHDREAAGGGASFKPPDLCGMIGCGACHDVIDRRVGLNAFSVDQIREFKHGGLLRTLQIYSAHFVLIERGSS